MTTLSSPAADAADRVRRTPPGRGSPRRPWFWALLLIVAAVGATAAVLLFADGGEMDEPSAALIAAIRAEPVVLATTGEPGAIEADEAVLDAGALRLLLEELLGEHVLLMSGASLDAADGQDLGSALTAVDPNSDALTGAIEFVYGEVGARAFGSLWNQHVAFFLDRARATGGSDAAGVTEADGHFHDYERDFGSFMQTATTGELPAEVVTALLEEHVADINEVVEAIRGDEADRGVTALISGHHHAADIGVGLAAAIAAQNPVAFPVTSDAQIEARSSLARAFAGDLAASSFADVAPEAAELARHTLALELGHASDDPAATRDALTALLEATDVERRPAAQVLSDKLPGSDPAAVSQAFETYVEGRGAGLLDPRTTEAHAAVYVLVSHLLVE